ncbi:MAG TPA: hypothetical protein VFA49_09420 [Chloroflexota bacterium]|nr:hypothetical protein [Chloroflexota bacterium]
MLAHLPGRPAQRTTRRPASPSGHGVATQRGRGDQQAAPPFAFPFPPILGAQQRGDAADGSGVDGNRQALLTQLGLDTKAQGFIAFHVLPLLPDRPTEPVPAPI